MRKLILSDGHSGHGLGLTPPECDSKPNDTESEGFKEYCLRRYHWNWFVQKIAPLRPFDLLIYNGDAIDGKGERSGGVEQLTTDRVKQLDIAEAVIRYINAPERILIAGTPYHTGVDEQLEKELAKRVDAEFHDALYREFYGYQFLYRHHIASSVSPYGNASPAMRAGTNMRAWHLEYPETYPLPDVLVRSHAHRFVAVDDGSMLSIVTPSLQGFGSMYGARMDRPPVHFGFVYFDLAEGGMKWNRELIKFPKVGISKPDSQIDESLMQNI